MTDFDQIYLKYFSDVYKYVLTLCRNDVIAEEITQETFFKAMRRIDQFNGSCKLFVWLCQIAKNAYFSYLRKDKRNIPYPENDDFEDPFDMAQCYLDEDMTRKLHFALHELTEPYKEVFSLKVFGELKYSQIGELFGKTENWARLVFYRAKIQIKEATK